MPTSEQLQTADHACTHLRYEPSPVWPRVSDELSADDTDALLKQWRPAPDRASTTARHR
jgi:hypothetical protein